MHPVDGAVLQTDRKTKVLAKFHRVKFELLDSRVEFGRWLLKDMARKMGFDLHT